MGSDFASYCAHLESPWGTQLCSSSGTGIGSFNPDGFTFDGSDATWNASGSTYVAWCWDMGNCGGSTKTISAVGGGVTGTSEKKFGTASLSLNGSSRCYTIPQHDDFSFGAGDFTVECWIYPNGSDNYDGVVTFQGSSSSTSTGYGIGYNNSNKIAWFTHLGNATRPVEYDTALSDNNWHHKKSWKIIKQMYWLCRVYLRCIH